MTTPTAANVISAPPLPTLDELGQGSAAGAKILDAEGIPGFAPAFTPDEADELGAFPETALSEEDAIDAAIDQIADASPS